MCKLDLEPIIPGYWREYVSPAENSGFPISARFALSSATSFHILPAKQTGARLFIVHHFSVQFHQDLVGVSGQQRLPASICNYMSVSHQPKCHAKAFQRIQPPSKPPSSRPKMANFNGSTTAGTLSQRMPHTLAKVEANRTHPPLAALQISLPYHHR